MGVTSLDAQLLANYILLIATATTNFGSFCKKNQLLFPGLVCLYLAYSSNLARRAKDDSCLVGLCC